MSEENTSVIQAAPLENKIQSGNNKKSIMLIDNQSFFLDALTPVLEEWGYVVASFTDPVQAMMSIQQNSFFLVLCASHMPSLSGYKLLYRFLQTKPKQNCCLMSSSELDDPILKKTIRLKNVTALLRKPVCFDKLKLLLDDMKAT